MAVSCGYYTAGCLQKGCWSIVMNRQRTRRITDGKLGHIACIRASGVIVLVRSSVHPAICQNMLDAKKRSIRHSGDGGSWYGYQLKEGAVLAWIEWTRWILDQFQWQACLSSSWINADIAGINREIGSSGYMSNPNGLSPAYLGSSRHVHIFNLTGEWLVPSFAWQCPRFYLPKCLRRLCFLGIQWVDDVLFEHDNIVPSNFMSKRKGLYRTHMYSPVDRWRL